MVIVADGEFGPEDITQLVTRLRPRLHRYCARMVGSAIEGEDVLQDALAKAAEALPSGAVIERPENWLFRIAHNTALDLLRQRKRRAWAVSGAGAAEPADPGAAADVRVTAASGLAALLRLSVTERASVALIDVLGHSAAEAVDIMGVSLAAVKAALHRGRTRLRSLADTADAPAPAFDPAERERLRAYADLFNARDFDALRALLAEDVRLDLVDRVRLAGRKDVSIYFTRYDGSADWRFSVGLAEGRPALLVSDPADPDGQITYVVLMDWEGDRIRMIRDFRYATYVVEDLALSRF